jgi:hypothetical protein
MKKMNKREAVKLPFYGFYKIIIPGKPAAAINFMQLKIIEVCSLLFCMVLGLMV